MARLHDEGVRRCLLAGVRSIEHANFIDLGSLIREFFRQFAQVVPRHLAQDNP
jgi:hypothetical protein